MINIRNFFISFFISLVFFALIAWLIFDKVMPDTGEEISEPSNDFVIDASSDNTENATSEVDEKENVILTGLVCCYDDITGRADSIMLVNINKNKETVTVCTIPSYLKIDIGTVNYKKEIYLGDILSDGTVKNGKNKFKSMVEAVTGLSVDHYAFMSSKDFINIINEIGGVEYDVPMDMYYKDEADNVLVNLDGDLSRLNGSQAYQLLRFRSYTVDKQTDDGDGKRRSVQAQFLKSVLDSLLKKENVQNIGGIASKLLKLIVEGETDFTATTVDLYLDLIQGYKNYTFRTVDYPVKSTEIVQLENGETIAVHNPDTSEAFKILSFKQ